MMKTVRVIFMVYMIFLASASTAQEVVFATLEKDIPPNVLAEKDKLRGIYVDIIRETCRRAGMEPVFKRYPWKRCVAYVKNGHVDAVFPPIRTAERETYLYFPGEPMTVKRIAVFALKDRHITIKGLEDLDKYVVGVNDGYSYGKDFDSRKGLKKDVSKHINMQVRKLVWGRMDVAVSVEDPFRYSARNLNMAKDIETIFVVSEESSYVAFSKANGAKGKQWAGMFGRALAQLRREGVIESIRDRYLK